MPLLTRYHPSITHGITLAVGVAAGALATVATIQTQAPPGNVAATAGQYAPRTLPDALLTPGAIDPSVTQANIHQTICVPGFSKTRRPPDDARWIAQAKAIYAAYGVPYNPRESELDHLESIELGGAPDDPKNLWPEPYSLPYGAKTKDALENKLHELVCSDALTLADAQNAISTDWVAAYQKYGGRAFTPRSFP